MTQAPSSAPARATRRYISDLRATGRAERITGPFSIANAQLGKTRSEKNYLRCLIGDKTGDMPGRMWTIDEVLFTSLPTDGFVWIEGETQPYQGELQMIIHAIQLHEPSPEELHDLLPASKRPPEEMFGELTALLATLEHPSMKALAEAFLRDEPLMSAFKQCPAARSLHHAYLGGLLEHTLGLLKLADAVCPLYPRISRDLVMMGLFLHDIGKTRELVFDRTFAYTDRGELVGHIVDGVLMLRDRAHSLMREQGIRFPTGALMVLEHIILSHHGQPEFGAVKIPSTPEAILVSMLDNVDAKTNMALAAARPDYAVAKLGGNFTEKQWALSTKLYRPDPLK